MNMDSDSQKHTQIPRNTPFRNLNSLSLINTLLHSVAKVSPSQATRLYVLLATYLSCW